MSLSQFFFFLNNHSKQHPCFSPTDFLFVFKGTYCLPGASGPRGDPGVLGPTGFQGSLGIKGQLLETLTEIVTFTPVKGLEGGRLMSCF